MPLFYLGCMRKRITLHLHEANEPPGEISLPNNFATFYDDLILVQKHVGYIVS